ncbi:MAG: DNA repair protein RadA [Bacteroidetes bacterium]|nr:DNA repair protein RadA [Bacteroidota bacterium]
MAKEKTAFFCTNCGNESAKWLGKCPACGEWNTLVEERVATGKKSASSSSSRKHKALGSGVATPISEVGADTTQRRDLCNEEVNRVLGGGLVKGSLVLLGGEPGIGKSTLSLQIALHAKDTKTLYISGEESNQQIKMRADRIGGNFENCLLLSETCVENIIESIDKIKPDIVIIDSIQTLYTDIVDSTTGGVAQIRECASQLMRYAKEQEVPIFIIGHITKDGNIAGPKILEHIVDVVLQFEGDSNNVYRILRSIKNRFGATSEIGVFEMLGNGLREVANPSDILLTHYDEPLSGIAVGATIDGIRPYLIETQALVSNTAFGMPQRSTTGFDTKRLNMLLAVVEKRIGIKMIAKDVFLNIAGGFKVSDPGLDLAVMTAMLSSAFDIEIPKSMTFAGEIGLSGEIRPASRTEQRVSEASRLGFKTIVISKYASSSTLTRYNIKIINISKVEEIVKIIKNNA